MSVISTLFMRMLVVILTLPLTVWLCGVQLLVAFEVVALHSFTTNIQGFYSRMFLWINNNSELTWTGFVLLLSHGLLIAVGANFGTELLTHVYGSNISYFSPGGGSPSDALYWAIVSLTSLMSLNDCTWNFKHCHGTLDIDGHRVRSNYTHFSVTQPGAGSNNIQYGICDIVFKAANLNNHNFLYKPC